MVPPKGHERHSSIVSSYMWRKTQHIEVEFLASANQTARVEIFKYIKKEAEYNKQVKTFADSSALSGLITYVDLAMLSLQATKPKLLVDLTNYGPSAAP